MFQYDYISRGDDWGLFFLRYINDLRGLAFGKLNNGVNQGNISLGNEKRQCSSIFIEFFVISPSYSVVFNEFNPAETSSQSYGNFIGNLNQLDHPQSSPSWAVRTSKHLLQPCDQ